MGKSRGHPQADSFGYWVFRLNRAMYAALSDRLSELGVAPAEWAVLAQAGRGGMTPVVLADQMGIDRAAVTRLIDQLERKGLVRRTPHPTDRRSSVVELTRRGTELLPDLIAASNETNRAFLQFLPPEESATLFALLRKLGEHLPPHVFPVAGCDTPTEPSSDAAAEPAFRSEQSSLTAREMTVLRAIASGRSNKEIATALGVGEQTVKTHVRNIFKKLGATDRLTAVMTAVRRGMIRPT